MTDRDRCRLNRMVRRVATMHALVRSSTIGRVPNAVYYLCGPAYIASHTSADAYSHSKQTYTKCIHMLYIHQPSPFDDCAPAKIGRRSLRHFVCRSRTDIYICVKARCARLDAHKSMCCATLRAFIHLLHIYVLCLFINRRSVKSTRASPYRKTKNQ